MWNFLDSGKNSLNFNDFCALGDHKSFRANDPFETKVLEQQMQDNLARERAEERERIAQEMLERMSHSRGSAADKMVQAK